MAEFLVDTYDISCLREPYDRGLVDALALIKRGVFELRNINGIENVNHESEKYTLVPLNFDRSNPVESPFKKFWERLESAERIPFLVAALDLNGKVVGALEGRKYVYAGTGDRSIFVNWIVVDKKYRKRGVARGIYQKVKEIGRKEDYPMLIAGINRLNTDSQIVHASVGFVNVDPPEELPTGERIMLPSRTTRGAYIPGYDIDDVDIQGNRVRSVIDVWTLRLTA